MKIHQRRLKNKASKRLKKIRCLLVVIGVWESIVHINIKQKQTNWENPLNVGESLNYELPKEINK